MKIEVKVQKNLTSNFFQREVNKFGILQGEVELREIRIISRNRYFVKYTYVSPDGELPCYVEDLGEHKLREHLT